LSNSAETKKPHLAALRRWGDPIALTRSEPDAYGIRVSSEPPAV
jgi:hypothetical protein